MAIASTVLAYTFIAINDYVPHSVVQKLNWVYGGGPQGARSVLSTIAGSVVTVAGTTFSITIAALTLASSQFGPRLLRTFRRDVGNQIVLGTFISTFLYCLLVLRTVLGTDKGQYVPDLAVTFGVILAVLSLAVLIYFIHHTAASIQVSTLMESVERELNLVIQDTFPSRENPHEPAPALSEGFYLPPEDTRQLTTPRAGYLIHIDYEGLINYAQKENCRIMVYRKPGSFSLPGLSLAAVAPASACQDDSALYGFFYFGSERTPEQDPEHAFLQLAEIGVRALSPGINDPFTAIACLDKLTRSMALIAERRPAPTLLCDHTNTPRVAVTSFQHDELVVAAFQFIRKAASGNREVLAHLSCRLTLLLERAEDSDLHLALSRQLALTEEDIRRCTL